ncbi:MAG: 5'/3'-nucleotidase SurE [Armatimonadetes bacterium]|nr:5'/3'-nucleotidase SurE [Armatimonadota bacterium]
MRILVTNDDGVHAEGLLALARVMADLGEVVVVAPERQQSAAGHGITLHKPLRIDPVRLDAPVVEAFATNGTPADCVILATADERPNPDLVVSGINTGANLAEEVLYSGTCSAAMEGALLGIRSFAVSVTDYDDPGFEAAAAYSRELARRLLETRLPEGVFLNVNIPNVPFNELGAPVITRLGRRKYVNVLERRTDPRGRDYYWFSGEPTECDSGEDTDIGAIQAGHISVTPVHYDLTWNGGDEQIEALVRASWG